MHWFGTFLLVEWRKGTKSICIGKVVNYWWQLVGAIISHHNIFLMHIWLAKKKRILFAFISGHWGLLSWSLVKANITSNNGHLDSFEINECCSNHGKVVWVNHEPGSGLRQKPLMTLLLYSWQNSFHWLCCLMKSPQSQSQQRMPFNDIYLSIIARHLVGWLYFF